MKNKTKAEMKARGFNLEVDGLNYASAEGILNDGETDTGINMGSVVEAKSVEIINDNTTAGEDFTAKFDDAGNDETTIKAGEARTFSKLPIRSILLTNGSGADIDFRIFIMGYKT